MGRSSRFVRTAVLAFSLCAAATVLLSAVEAQEVSQAADRFVEARGIRLHYLDFGGSGLPVVFRHGSHFSAEVVSAFAARFADDYRPLAVTRRGYGQSQDVGWGYDPATQGEDLIAFLDAVGIEQAVLVGNSRAADLVYVAEHHPDRLAGLVFLNLTPQPPPGLLDHPATREFWQMAMRGACDLGDEAVHRLAPRYDYRPHFAYDQSTEVRVPSLLFVNRKGRAELPRPGPVEALEDLVELAASEQWCDPGSREYFAQLLKDEERLAELQEINAESVDFDAYVEAFERAFTALEKVRLDVPAVTGYEYLRDPDRIYLHVRRFLDGLPDWGRS